MNNKKKKKNNKRKKKLKICLITLGIIISVLVVVLPIMQYINVTEVTSMKEIEEIANSSDLVNFFIPHSYIINPQKFEYVGVFDYTVIDHGRYSSRIEEKSRDLYSFVFDGGTLYTVYPFKNESDYSNYYIEVNTFSYFTESIISIPSDEIKASDYLITFRTRDDDLIFKVLFCLGSIIYLGYKWTRD